MRFKIEDSPDWKGEPSAEDCAAKLRAEIASVTANATSGGGGGAHGGKRSGEVLHLGELTLSALSLPIPAGDKPGPAEGGGGGGAAAAVLITLLLMCLGGGGGYYYWKVYRKRARPNPYVAHIGEMSGVAAPMPNLGACSRQLASPSGLGVQVGAMTPGGGGVTGEGGAYVPPVAPERTVTEPIGGPITASPLGGPSAIERARAANGKPADGGQSTV